MAIVLHRHRDFLGLLDVHHGALTFVAAVTLRTARWVARHPIPSCAALAVAVLAVVGVAVNPFAALCLLAAGSVLWLAGFTGWLLRGRVADRHLREQGAGFEWELQAAADRNAKLRKALAGLEAVGLAQQGLVATLGEPYARLAALDAERLGRQR